MLLNCVVKLSGLCFLVAEYSGYSHLRCSVLECLFSHCNKGRAAGMQCWRLAACLVKVVYVGTLDQRWLFTSRVEGIVVYLETFNHCHGR